MKYEKKSEENSGTVNVKKIQHSNHPVRSDKVNNVISSRRQWQIALWVGVHRIKPSRSECSLLLILLLSSLVVLWSVFFAHSRAEEKLLTLSRALSITGDVQSLLS